MPENQLRRNDKTNDTSYKTTNDTSYKTTIQSTANIRKASVSRKNEEDWHIIEFKREHFSLSKKRGEHFVNINNYCKYKRRRHVK